MLLGLKAAAEDDLHARPSHHDDEAGHDHDDFESFVVADPGGEPRLRSWRTPPRMLPRNTTFCA